MKPQWKSEIRLRLAGLHLAPTSEAAIVEELAQYLEDYYAELLAGGVSEAEAYEQAFAELSGSELLEGELRRVEKQSNPEPIELGDNRRTSMIADLWQDLRFGLRMLRKAPGFTAVAVFSLALGIGANTAIFSLLDALLLKKLPVPQPERLVVVTTAAPGQAGSGISSFSYPVFRELRDGNVVFSGIFAHDALPVSMSGGGQTERVLAELVSGNFFAVV